MAEGDGKPPGQMTLAERIRRIDELKAELDQLAMSAAADARAEERLSQFRRLCGELEALDAYTLFPRLKDPVGTYGSDLHRWKGLAEVERTRRARERLKARR